NLLKKKKSYLNNFALLKFSGLLSSRVRNKAGLKIMLNYFFPQYKIDIKEFVPQWIELTEIPSLGDKDFSLGKNSFIGKYSRDCMSRISIHLQSITFDEYLNFLPGTENSNKLKELLDLYLNDGIEYDFEFTIKADTITAVSWGDERLKLGSTLWLGKPEKAEVKVYLSYEELNLPESSLN
ncbi:MAG TPA: type VI secretion system baseplate subunit TssG, partial [Ignavibacteriaceae bacterium]|nr:type VI secretion system baseplate subunit TssG [Ignavibacteriaceae bacterium]